MTQAGRQQPVERLSGTVERVVFHNEQSGFCVLRVEVAGRREPVAVVGTIPAVQAGEWIDAEGVWQTDKEHGRQFRADSLRMTPPSTAEGIQRYLASGLIHGIGPTLAERLVRKFGTEVLEIIDTASRKLLAVEGIGPQRLARIRQAWAEQKSVRQIMLFLHSCGVSTGRAFRIYKAYGEQAIELVRADPYRLARDIWGIGFKTADQISEKLGVDRLSPLRARAGVEYALQQLTEQGHCAYGREELVKTAEQLLGIPAEIIERAVDEAAAAGRVVLEPSPEGQELVYLASLHRAEVGLAEALLRLARGRHPCPPIDADKAIAWVEKRVGLTLAAQQRQALALATKAKVMVITGGPGVGKTTLVNSIVQVLAAKGLEVVLCAPTGRAAKRLGESTRRQARTIHRLLAFDPSTGRFRHHVGKPLEGDVFIIDEMSMVDLALAHQVVSAIPPSASLLLVGDVDQLPSVGPGSVLRDIIDSAAVPVVRLTEVFRQAAASAIITNAHRINQGQMPIFPPPLEEGAHPADFYFVQADDPQKAVELIVEMVRHRIPKRFGFEAARDIQVIAPMHRGAMGARNLNEVLQRELNPAGPAVQRFGQMYRVGDKVMQTVNDYDKDVFNGDIGHVESIDEPEGALRVRFDDRLVAYDLRELDELALSYAITVHKSQGSEYPVVIVPVHTQHYVMLQRNLLYTAITRSRRLVVLVGMEEAIGLAVRRISSRRRITTLRQRLAAAGRVAPECPAAAQRSRANGTEPGRVAPECPAHGEPPRANGTEPGRAAPECPAHGEPPRANGTEPGRAAPECPADTRRPRANGTEPGRAAPECLAHGRRSATHPPLAYHITFGTYGARLHGDERGTVDREHNTVGHPALGQDDARRAQEAARLRHPPVLLTEAEQLLIEKILPDICRRGGWELHEAACGADHVHVILSAAADGQTVRRWLKRWLGEELSTRRPLGMGHTWWAEGGSVKWIWDQEYLQEAREYVREQRKTLP